LARGIAERSFDSVANEAVTSGGVRLGDYAVVVWAVGEESTAHRAFDTDEQSLVRGYLDEGGALIASGAEIAYDLAQGSAADQAFLSEVLGTGLAADSTGTTAFYGASSLADFGDSTFLAPDTLDVRFPDGLIVG